MTLCEPEKEPDESPGPLMRHESGLPDTDQLIITESLRRTEVFGDAVSTRSATYTVTTALE